MAKSCVRLDDVMNKRLRQVPRGLWSFHMNLKSRFNLDFRESKLKFLPPIPSPPWPRVNIHVLFCNPHLP